MPVFAEAFMRRSLVPLLLVPLTQPGCGGPQTPLAQPDAPDDIAFVAGPPVPIERITWESQAFVATPDLPTANATEAGPPPVSLTASDGTGLQVMSLSAQAVIEDPVAFTELHLVFRNPEARTIEGRFEITLPEGATVSRFAMRNGDVFQEGEVVELQAARRAYEDFLHRKQDPALLEKQAGNQFQARVFPIPASSDKEVVLSYSEELKRSQDPYRLHLRGLPRLDTLKIRVFLRDGEAPRSGTPLFRRALELEKQSFTPDHDFTVPLPSTGNAWTGVRSGFMSVARIAPAVDTKPDPIDGLLVLFDTSASSALGFSDRVQRLATLLQHVRSTVDPDAPVVVACFDQVVQEVYRGPSRGLGAAAFRAIVDRRPLGASDLGSALAYAAKARLPRVLLVTDGIPTAGTIEATALADTIGQLRKAGVGRVDTVVEGGIRDEALLRRVASGGTRDGVVADGGLAPVTLATKFARATVSGIHVDVPGSRWVYPRVLDGMQPGDQAIVYADLARDRPMTIQVGKETMTPHPVTFTRVEEPLLGRAWVNARIHFLTQNRDGTEDEGAREKLRLEIIDLSTRYRVLSDFTAMLVLETDADYARFNIDRSALTDILTVGPGGLCLQNRKTPGAEKTLQLAESSDSSEAKQKATEAKRPRADGVRGPSGTSHVEGAGMNEVEGPAERDSRRAPATMAPPPEPAAAPQPPPPAPAPVVIEQRPGAPGGSDPAKKPRSSPPPPPKVARILADQSAPGRGENARPSARFAAPAAPREAEESRRREQAPHSPRPPAQAPRVPVTGLPLAGASDGVLDTAGGRRAGGLAAATPPTPVPTGNDPYEGRFRDVMTNIAARRPKEALAIAAAWRDAEPGDVLALVALGEGYEALGDQPLAARAYGSLIDLFPGRADLRRFAGERLERLGAGLALASDTYRQAVAQRPDHPASHRLLAYALVREGRYEEAFEAILNGTARSYPDDRFRGVPQILQEDVGLIAAAWMASVPAKGKAIRDRLAALSIPLPTEPSLRFVVNWETDGNDLDLHVWDGQGGHAYYQQKTLPSGGGLYADVTTGYGPECFTIPGRPSAFPYRIQAHYFSRGPMGYGMGKLEILQHDGNGGLRFEERPFVVMTDRAFVDLGVVSGPLGGLKAVGP